jgi:hypothetical protein
MKILLSVVLTIFALYQWEQIRWRRRTSSKVDGCTLWLREDRDIAWLVYSEPSGKMLTFEVHRSGRRKNEPMLVDFPSILPVPELPQRKLDGQLVRLEIPDTHSSQLSQAEADLVRERISRGLTQLKIPHEFVRPQLSGWTSFEDGNEIYRGGPGVI